MREIGRHQNSHKKPPLCKNSTNSDWRKCHCFPSEIKSLPFCSSSCRACKALFNTILTDPPESFHNPQQLLHKNPQKLLHHSDVSSATCRRARFSSNLDVVVDQNTLKLGLTGLQPLTPIDRYVLSTPGCALLVIYCNSTSVVKSTNHH